MSLTIQGIRSHAIAHTFRAPTDLATALDRMGFVQADPIRAPARAQDLILRQRVTDYRAGDLESRYESLDVEEDYLYAYGFVARPTWRLLHPRTTTKLKRLDQQILDVLKQSDVVHPRDLETQFGRRRVVNAWGGYSRATKSSLERLHFRGLVRVACRENGVRSYRVIPPIAGASSPEARLSGLMLMAANVLAPVSERTLLSISARLRRWVAPSADYRAELKRLVASGAMERGVLEGVGYVWPTRTVVPEEPPQRVRLLAPFDPLVWDRRRLEQLWGWAYRFEAYTPVAKRVRGYYALPLLWGDSVIGWANASWAAGRLDVQVGFVERRPRDRAFKAALDGEISRLEEFLEPRDARFKEPAAPIAPPARIRG